MKSQTIRKFSTLSHELSKTFPYKLNVQSSRRLKTFGFILALGAAFILFKLGLPTLLCILPICYYFVTKSSHLELLEIEEKCWAILEHGELIFQGVLRSDSFLSNHFILLNLQDKNSNKIRRIPLLSDMIPPEQFRRLKVHLLLSSHPLGR